MLLSNRRSVTHVGLLSVMLVLAGSCMQGYANGTMDSILMAIFQLFAGITIVNIVFSRGRAEQRAFLLTYGVCVFVGGVVQCYSLAVFNNPQSTIDAIYTFFPNISSQPPFTTMKDLSWRVAPTAMAILTWQQVYKLAWALGFKFGPYIGVMFNALVMGFTGSITVGIVRELFGDDAWRLRRSGTLFAFCGLFILFGSILLRDCFTTFFSTLVLWGLVRWLSRPTLRNMFLAVVLTGISLGATMYLRSRSIVIFGLFWALALICWFFEKRQDFSRFLVSLFVVLALLLSFVDFMKFIEFSLGLRSMNTERYADIMAQGHTEDSLAMRLIVHQPLPVRIILGSGALMVYPIPLWAHYKYGSSEYHLIKGYHGIYQVLVLPLVLTGALIIFKRFRDARREIVPLLFLVGYTIISLLAVVATSLEQRHFAQFMPAMIILAVVPDTRERAERKRVQDIARGWIVVVGLVHLAWIIVK